MTTKRWYSRRVAQDSREDLAARVLALEDVAEGREEKTQRGELWFDGATWQWWLVLRVETDAPQEYAVIADCPMCDIYVYLRKKAIERLRKQGRHAMADTMELRNGN